MTPHSSPRPSETVTSQAASPQAAAIREQLARILESSFFNKSKRYKAFLKYSVEQVLAGRNESLKERIVGIEVFGRPADYNTGADHVVRSAAGEIRKRLAQYYGDPTTAGEVRIDVSPGSYIPQFSFPQQEAVRLEKLPVTHPPGSNSHNIVRHWTILGIATMIVLVVITAFALSRPPQTTLDRFWNPVFSSRSAVLLCVGSRNLPQVAGATAPSETGSGSVSFASATTVARLAGLLQSRGKQFQVLLRSATNFGDLQHGPSVLIGGFNNNWTRLLTETLRFSFNRQQGQSLRILDRQNPARNDWSVNFLLPHREITRDYAIVSRVSDPKTEQTTVIVAGIGRWGTLAAGEFVTDAAQMQKLQALAPKGWERMNMQFVLSTDVIDGVSGHPKILATQFW